MSSALPELRIRAYENEFAILNKSFRRDLDRSIQLYVSFEVFFENADAIPFYVCVPEADLHLFRSAFAESLSVGRLRRAPHIIADETVLAAAGEQNIAFDGKWCQQVVKMSFGFLNVARTYMSIDSDCYFTKPFSPRDLFQGKTLKTVAWKIPPDWLEKYKGWLVPFDTCAEPYKGLNDASGYDNFQFIKNFFGSRNPEFHVFVAGHGLWNADALYRFRDFAAARGAARFSRLIRMVPFEQQWYGEYILQNEPFVPAGPVFLIIGGEDEDHPEDGGAGYFGVCFQSVDYANSNAEQTRIRYSRKAGSSS